MFEVIVGSLTYNLSPPSIYPYDDSFAAAADTAPVSRFYYFFFRL